MSLRSFVIAFLCLALGWAGSVTSATAQPAEKPAKADRMVRVTYPVGDLVADPNGDRPAHAESLVNIITETVAPKTWKQSGGAGAIQYFPMGMAIVVYQRADVQAEIAALLAELRVHAFGERLPMPREGGAEEQAIPEAKKLSGVKKGDIESRLRQPINFHFKGIPLKNVVEDLANLAGVPIVLELKALKNERIDPAAPVTFKASDIDMKSALNLMLNDLDLTYVVENDVLVVTTKASQTGKLVRKIYPIGDLIKPIMILDNIKKNDNEAADSVKGTIQDVIAKNSWESMGGNGNIQYFPNEKKLVVNQTNEVHEEVALLLATLRKLYDFSVAIESRAVVISAKGAKQLRQDLAQQGKSVDVIDAKESPALVSIDDNQLRKLLEFAQTDRTACVLQAPKITLLNGQSSKIGGMVEGSGGTMFEYRPVVSPDRRSVRLAMTYEYRSTTDSVERIIRATKGFNLPDGRTLVWNLGASSDGQHHFVLVTSRILVQQEEERIFLGELPAIPR